MSFQLQFMISAALAWEHSNLFPADPVTVTKFILKPDLNVMFTFVCSLYPSRYHRRSVVCWESFPWQSCPKIFRNQWLKAYLLNPNSEHSGITFLFGWQFSLVHSLQKKGDRIPVSLWFLPISCSEHSGNEYLASNDDHWKESEIWLNAQMLEAFMWYQIKWFLLCRGSWESSVPLPAGHPARPKSSRCHGKPGPTLPLFGAEQRGWSMVQTVRIWGGKDDSALVLSHIWSLLHDLTKIL